MGSILKNGWFWFAILVVVIVIVLYKHGYLSEDETVISYRLPKTSSPPEFGPKYWAAIHDLVGRVPCPSCREKGKSLFIFAHDIVNHKLEKPIFDKENFDYWVEHIKTLDNPSLTETVTKKETANV